MLQELRIKDFAIIDDITLTMQNGFLVLTGETGAGKSIIVDAVNLLLGDRSDATFVRAGADRAVIEGTFGVPPTVQADLNDRLATEEIENDNPAELVLTREVRANGRSQARVNGSICRLALFREIGGMLVDVHGQSEHLSLLKPAQHLFLLDNYAGLEAEREALRSLVQSLGQVRDEIHSLLMDEAALARRVDMLQYQVQEIVSADLQPGEEDALNQERNRLVNAERIAGMAAEAEFALSGEVGETPGVEDLLAQTALVLDRLAALDPVVREHADLAETLSAQASELARMVRTYGEEIEHDPLRLNEIEERAEIITNLKRKYGGSVEAVLDFAAQAQAELDAITHSEERLAELHAEEDLLLHEIGAHAVVISERRQEAGIELQTGIVTELADLRMANARFEVRITHSDDPEGCYVGERRLAFNVHGIDHVEFFIAANVGEPLRPLVKVASGGETARIMLALKGVLSHADRVPTLIFDEVDQGIGGRLGSVLGQKLWRLSEHHQVLVVTHLAQLAGFADMHFRVSKHVQDDRTVTRTEQLDDQGRVDELAAMLGAETDSARQSAYDILMLARRAKEGRWLETA